MSLVDTNRLIRQYLTTAAALTNPLIALVAERVYIPRLPENATLPAVSLFTRGGSADPNYPKYASPSIQIDCWAANSIDAREVYRALYDAMQGLVSVSIVIGGTTYFIMKISEEVHGQDRVDNEIQNYFKVMSFYSVTIKDTT